MPHWIGDGTVISSNFPVGFKSTPSENEFSNFSLLKARVDEVLYTDDNRNTTFNKASKQVQYVCTIISGPQAGKRLYNVMSLSLGGGTFNSGEIIYDGLTNEDNSGTNKKQPSQTSGTIVLIGRLHGNINANVILGCLKHPTSTVAGTKESAHRLIWEYNGVTFEINKDGEFSISFGGGQKNSSGEATNSSSAGSQIKLDKNGGITIKDKNGNGIVIDQQGQQVSFTGTILNIGTAGKQAARLGDLVFGTDAEGRPINAYIGTGSSNVLIGG